MAILHADGMDLMTTSFPYSDRFFFTSGWNSWSATGGRFGGGGFNAGGYSPRFSFAGANPVIINLSVKPANIINATLVGLYEGTIPLIKIGVTS